LGDEVYNRDTADRGIAEIIVPKNRHGMTGMVKANWLGQYQKFENFIADEDVFP
jgi:replicative DNA helicase